MTCMCGDSECPSCGMAQGTYTGGRTDEVAEALAERDEAVALLRRVADSVNGLGQFGDDVDPRPLVAAIDTFLARIEKEGESR